MCGYIAVFWCIRVTLQAFLDVKAHLTTWWLMLGYHNHTEEFEPLADSSQRPYDVLLAETDPSLVAMELDIGWAYIRMLQAVGHKVVSLRRTAFGPLRLGRLKTGAWRVLSAGEVAALRRATGVDQP